MDELRLFASFIAKKKLKEFTTTKLRHIQALNAPILQHLGHLSEDDIRQRISASALEFFHALEEDHLEDHITLKMKSWEDNLLAGVTRTTVSLSDITLINAAERLAFISLLPDYTKNAQTAAAVMEGLEKYFTLTSRLAFQTIQRIQEEESNRLQESEERYKDLFDNATDLIHIEDPGGMIMYVNKAWQEALGYDESELKGTSIYELVAERERERFRAFRERIVAGLPAIETLITVLRAKDGHEVFVEGFLTCKFRGSKPLYTRGILRNVTQRAAAEQKIQFYTEQLVEREENLRQMIRNAPDAIVVIDTSSNIKLWNPMAEKMFGWEAMEIVGKNLTETIIPYAFREAHLKGMERYLETGEERMMHRTIESTALSKENKELFVSLTISPSRQGGEPVFIAFIRDISLQKQNAVELEKKKEELERTNKELEQFAWLASHDLKEPLRKIRTFSDLLLHKSSLPEDVTRFLEKIEQSAVRMSNLIEDLLSYSNAGPDDGQFVLSNLNDIVQDVLIDLEVAIKAKQAVIHLDTLPEAEVLPFQMRQLFQNLISNALKYSKAGTIPHIEIRCSVFSHESVQITVKDNGIGFKSEYSEKVFQIFQRLVNREAYEGTGIGLALCKKIIENHSGSIKAESEEGTGTTFTIMLPVKHAEPALPAVGSN